MSQRLKRGAIAGTTVAMGLALLGPTAAFAAAAPDRAAVDAVPDWAASAKVVGHTAGSAQLHMSAVLNLRNAAGAERLAQAVSDPASATYRQYVSPEQWRARFAPTAQQVGSVTSWLKANGFSVTEVPANNRYVAFDGTVAQAEKAFGTTLSNYDKAGRTVTAPSRPVTIPGSLAGTLAGIAGLDSSALSTPSHVDPRTDAFATASPAAASTLAAPSAQLPPPGPVFRNAKPCSDYYGQKKATGVPQILADPLTYAPCGYKPGQIRGAYGLDNALKDGHDGSGVTVAIVDAYASPTILSDAQTYARRNDPAHPLKASQFAQITPRSYRGQDVCGPQGWYGEETLDVEAAHATAPGAFVLYVGGRSCYNNDLLAAVNSIVDGALAQIVSNSYGSTGESATNRAEHQTFLQAAAQGISMLFSSGDSGDNKDRTGVRQIDTPAGDPYITSVGGTALAVGKYDNYLFEQGWGTGRSVLDNGKWTPRPPQFLYGGGGGISRVWDQPYYQRGVVRQGIATQYGGLARAIPDIAMVGDPNTGFLVGQTQQFPDGSLRYSEYRIGGTSLSSPLFGGVTAVADQVAGMRLGFLNPALYRLNGTSAVMDVNHGRKVTDGVVRVDYANGVNASNGTVTSLRTLNQTGSIYTRKGWDDVTGVGTPNGVAFLNALAK